MRPWILALLVTIAFPALAQALEQAPPAAPTAEIKAPPPAPATENKPPPPENKPAAPSLAALAPAAKATPPAAPPVPSAAPVLAPKPQSAPTAPAAAAALGAEKKYDTEAYRRDQEKFEASFILENLITGDARAEGEPTYSFQFEGKKYNPPEELVAAWVKRTPLTVTNLSAVEVLSMAERGKKYGKPRCG